MSDNSAAPTAILSRSQRTGWLMKTFEICMFGTPFDPVEHNIENEPMWPLVLEFKKFKPAALILSDRL